ncbi:aminodeoxychorismate lyase [Vibrio sonorensis]|uniref:aminodeoxychorismate lyase n=1 Tax=Vibrio sonorensis TaxID=1004316 RepID=UPI0008D8FE7E|nr:aminodeoxychorismate lyase [Vibrio sonorensis]
MYWVNGKVAQTVDIGDRSFQYGDGCFTTMLTLNGSIHLWHLHKERMVRCLDLLGIVQPDWFEVECWLNHASQPSPKAGLKLHISRGAGGRGYGTDGADKTLVTISDFAFPSHYLQWQENGIDLGVCTTKLGHNPLLAGHKHNNRLEQVLAKREAESEGFADALVLDIDNKVVETTMANLFWCKDQTLFTPTIDKAGVAGVARKQVMSLAKDKGMSICEGHFKLDELYLADEIFITNSVIGVCPVTAISGRTYKLGVLTKHFQETYYP